MLYNIKPCVKTGFFRVFAPIIFILFSTTIFAQTSPGSWPNGTTLSWVAVLASANTPVTDAPDLTVDDEIDFTTCVSTPASAYMAYDGTNIFFRFQLVADPRVSNQWSVMKAWKVDFATTNNIWTGGVELAVPNSVSLRLPSPSRIEINAFQADQTGSTYVRVVQGTSTWFLDFQIPYSVLTTNYSINLTQPFKVFFSTVDRASLSPSAPDYMLAACSSIDYSAAMAALSLSAIGSGVFPVELSAFSAFEKDGDVHLAWKTTTEVNNYGFAVERSADGGEWTQRTWVPGYGTSSIPHSYAWIDRAADVLPGAAYYRLRQVDRDGTVSFSPTVLVSPAKAGTTRLTDIYPNPFNPSSTVHFVLGQAGIVHLSLVDATGKTLRAVIPGEEMSAGSHAVTLQAPDLPSGNYFVVLRTADGQSMQPVTLLK